MQQAALSADETDGGKPKGLPTRTCIATRAVRPVSELIRFVAAPDGTLTADLKASLPGRGVWVSADKTSIVRAMKGKAFAAAMKRNVQIDADLPEKISSLIRQRALQALSFANKAGNIVCGTVKIEKALSRKPLALLHASDGGADGIEKLDRLYRTAAGAQVQIFTLFSGVELDMALGRSNVIHAALMEGSAARACLQWFEKVTIYEGGSLCYVDKQERAENE